MTSRRVLVRRAAGFGALPVLSALSPLVALPILARLATVDQWAAIAVGQSVGGIGAIALSAGWSVTGAPLAALSDEVGRRELLFESLTSRLVAGLVAVPVAAALTCFIAGWSVLAALSSTAVVLTGFSITWYAVGTGEPRPLAIVETVPRVATNLIAACVAGLAHRIEIYPLATGLVALLPIVAFYGPKTRGVRRRGWLRIGVRRLRANAAAAGAELVAAAYSLGATAIVGLAATTEVVARFNVGYRLTALGSIAITTVSSSLQSWTSEAHGDQFRRRVRLAAYAHLAVGLIGLGGLALLGPWAARIIFGGALSPGRLPLIYLGVFFLFWSLETLTARLVLAARGETRALFSTTAAGSLFGIGAIYLLSRWRGEVGAAAGLAMALMLIVALQAPRAMRIYRDDR